jgi:hypothetical protein
MKTLIVRSYLVWSILGSAIPTPQVPSSNIRDDHLVPLKADINIRNIHDLDRTYEKMVRSKLFVARGEIARMVQYPGTWGVETVVSVHRCNAKEDSAQFCVTITEASEMLWPFARDNKIPTHVTVKRCEAPLSEAAARAIEKTWSAMIADARPEADADRMIFEGTRAVYYVIDPAGRERRAEEPMLLEKKTSALSKLGLFLETYCSLPASMRPDGAKQIEKMAASLLKK